MNSSSNQQTGCPNGEQEILFELFSRISTGDERLILQEAMKKVRMRCGRFSETEAILHMMEALIVESTERRGW